MKKSHAAGWDSDSPTPAQLKEFFAQIGKGQVTKSKLQAFLRSRYADEEAASNYTYPSKYAAKPVDEQIRALSKLFSLDPASALVHARNLPELPKGAEAWFAIPKWQMVADNYGKALGKAFDLIEESRRFMNWRDSQISMERFRQPPDLGQALENFENWQSGDIILIPAQFGFRHRGRSARRAREVFTDNEFELGAFVVACLILVHPEREQAWEQLHVDCACGDFVFEGQPESSFFRWYEGKLEFSAGPSDNTHENVHMRYGLASGFLPED